MHNLIKVLASIFLVGSLAGCVAYGGRSYDHGGYGYGPSYGYGGGYYSTNGGWQNWQDRQQYNIHRQ